MSVRNVESCSEIKENLASAHFFIQRKRCTLGAKFNASFERTIERLLSQSQQIGWSYDDFAVRLLEVLVVLRHRDSLKHAAASRRNAAV
jgi:hypothetical protein